MRALVVKARSDIEMARLPSTLDGLREFHRKVMSGEWRRLRPLTAWEDFWSASLLRDLCFHVQEHRFTVSRLRTFLEGSGLRFLGFEFNVGASQSAAAHAGPLELYRARFPPNGRCPTSPAGNSSNARSRTCSRAMPSSARKNKAASPFKWGSAPSYGAMGSCASAPSL